MSDALEDRVRSTITGPVEEMGLDLEVVELPRSGSKRLLRIAVDADGGVGIDAIARVTRAISAALDEDDVLGAQPYTLEVTSRGLDRPLTELRHWRRAAGRLVAVTLTDGTSVSGRVIGSDPDGVDVAVGQDQRRLAHDEIATAVITPELNPKKV